jgi:hypothetical protein
MNYPECLAEKAIDTEIGGRVMNDTYWKVWNTIWDEIGRFNAGAANFRTERRVDAVIGSYVEQTFDTGET